MLHDGGGGRLGYLLLQLAGTHWSCLLSTPEAHALLFQDGQLLGVPNLMSWRVQQTQLVLGSPGHLGISEALTRCCISAWVQRPGRI